MGHLQPPQEPELAGVDLPSDQPRYLYPPCLSPEVSVAHCYFCHALDYFSFLIPQQNVLLRSSHGASGSTVAA
jgi:hypothetical protein